MSNANARQLNVDSENIMNETDQQQQHQQQQQQQQQQQPQKFASTNPQSTNSGVALRQSFLSKFARSEVKSSKSIDKSAHLNRASESQQPQQLEQEQQQPSSENRPSEEATSGDQNSKMAPTTISRSTIEIDSDKSLLRSSKQRAGLGGNLFPNRATKSFCENDTGERSEARIPDDLTLATVDQKTTARRLANDNPLLDSNNNHVDDDNDQVLPFWPSKIDTTTLEPSMFQVYSLKDYSQVAGPTENVASSTAGGRLLKSMSQDRKVDSRTKRMSECILSSQTTAGDSKSSSQARQQRLPSMIGKISSTASTASTATTTTNMNAIGPATSVNSLLPQTKNTALIIESRIDRMRKLFVSPLSLRGSTGGKSSQSPHQASSHSRLSLQAGANMLNKPHHLMHAMYRTRVGAGPHYSRRSPMRQKPGSVRGFRVYGCPLSMANTMYPITCFGRPDIYKQQSVPYILARLCYFIEENSSQLTHEGIFRVSGNARLMEKLKTLFDHLGDAPLESESVDVATSASMLKMYLRELPDPVIPTRMNYHFSTLAKKYSSILSKSSFDGFRASDNIVSITATSTIANEPSSISDGQSTLDRQKVAFIRDITKLIRKLPIENYNLLKYLACFLHRISLKQQSNKMSAEALGIVFGPNVFRIRSESYKGLKEQGLSNQIMASIITNYKQIFDCELTDALGNLVKGEDELIAPGREHETSEDNDKSKLKQLDLMKKEAAPTRSAKKERDTNVSPLPTTSTSAHGLAHHNHNHHHHHHHHQHRSSHCPRHGRQISYRYSDDADESDDDDEDNVEDDDGGGGVGDHDDEDDEGGDGDSNEDEECDDESYSQTSDSGSYCSSMASESVESVYEGDVEGEQFDDEDDEFALGSGSSSECGSETSYTPSSSHSDTNANEVELSSSNFSSNHSLARANDDNETTQQQQQQQQQQQKPCLVCKRRESAQIEANKIRDQMRLPKLNAPSEQPKEAAETGQEEGEEGEEKQKSPGAAQQLVASMTAEASAAGQNQLASVKNSTRLSTRRKRAGDESKKTSATPATTTTTTATTTSFAKSDAALDVKCATLSDQNTRPSRHGHQARSDHKHGLLRRRSSSASSLLRVSNKLEQAAARKRSVGREEAHNHRSRVHSDRRRGNNEQRNYSRRSRNKTYAPRKDNHNRLHARGQQVVGSSNSNSNSSNNKARFGSKGYSEWNKGDCFVPGLMAMNLTPVSKDDEFCWNYVSPAALLDVPDCERFYQLRSYNSDETLLRSQDCNDRCSVETATRARRRFSGQDYLHPDQENLLANIHPAFQQISETYEGDATIYKADDNGEELLEDELAGGLEMSGAQSSVVSLLSDQLVNFYHSTLSLNEEHADPMAHQLRVIKDLIRALERLARETKSKGLASQEVANHLNQLLVANDAESEELQLDSIATCCFDPLSARNLIAMLESHERDRGASPEIDSATQERLIDLVATHISDLKKRYTSLKYIREHYYKHHNRQRQKTENNNPSATSPERNKETSVGVDKQSLESDDTPPIILTATAAAAANNAVVPDKKAAPQTSKQAADMALQADTCEFGSLCPVEFVFNIEKQLASRRRSGSRLVRLNDMTLAQLLSEKLELQKNLLRYEHWFGRPSTRAEFNLVGHLYERYRAVKIIKQQKQATV